MTNTQHTPGPWRADNDAYVADEYGLVIADVFINDDDNWKERAANARLIAAAPDLLAALEHIEWAVTGFGDFEAQYPHVIAEVRAAIAKATGE